MGSPRSWLFGIARHVYAGHQAQLSNGRDVVDRIAGQIVLGEDEIEELAARIDDQREGRRLLRRCAELSDVDRAGIELVDLEGLSVKEAAAALDVSSGALRVRLFRARARLRKGGERNG